MVKMKFQLKMLQDNGDVRTTFCPSLVSVALINVTKSNLRRKAFVSTYVLWYTIKKARAGLHTEACKQELRQRRIKLPFTYKEGPFLRDVTAHSGLGFSISISNQGKTP